MTISRARRRLTALALFAGAALATTPALGPSDAIAARARAAAAVGGPAYANAVDPRSPWPQMRRTASNSGRSPIAARYRGDHPWSFRTRRGIFSTPVIGGDGTVYFGSADGNFYAVKRDGHERWRFHTGGVIDAAAAIGRYDSALRTTPITIGSGDERLYRLRAGRGRRVIWAFRPTQPPVPGQLVSWWEGNVALGPDGAVYAGNTGGAAYAIQADGRLRWVYTAGQSVWTTPAFAVDGSSWWGSLDLSIHHLDVGGRQLCSQSTLGYVISSPALGSDGTVYVASFDSKLYALDPATCAAKWTFGTADHVYASPALGVDAHGRTNAVYIASADGSIYKLSASGRLIWRYDTGDAIRSSPALGRAPAPGRGEIVYVGSSDGRLYAIDAATGRRRWSFDTTPRDPLLRDRNDLNSSPALGTTGVYIGGEHGYLWYVPYDYCLHRRDRRCARDPGEPFGANLKRVLYVTPGGTTEPPGPPGPVSAATVLSTRLLVRRHGSTLNAALVGQPTADALVHSSPGFRFSTQLSGDGRFLMISPDGFLAPHTEYRVSVAGAYASGGTRVGNRTVGATPTGSVADTITFRTAAARGPLPLRVGGATATALTIRRLAVPLPAFLPSVNQIGFDSYDLIAGTLARSRPDAHGEGSVLMWVIGARRDARGAPLADPGGNFAFPLAGRYHDDFVILSARNVNLQFSFGPVPMRRFEIRGQLGRKPRFLPGASLYAEVTCSTVPTYGPLLPFTGICNAGDTLAASGTFVSDPYPAAGPANRRPAALSVSSVTLQRPTTASDGAVTARLALAPGAHYPATRHIGSILLTDAATGAPVPLDYHAATADGADASGDLSQITLALARDTVLPAHVRAYVIADVFPLETLTL